MDYTVCSVALYAWRERRGERERIQEELLDEQAAKTSLYKGLHI